MNPVNVPAIAPVPVIVGEINDLLVNNNFQQKFKAKMNRKYK